MNTSFYSGLSGLSAYAGALNIVGNNLANLNTTGFKASDISFEDLVTRTFGGVATNGAGNPMQVGLGTLPNSVSGIFSQGSIMSSADSTNVALEGNGFFVVGNSDQDRFYTRAGNFFFNSDGYLVNPSGHYVLGYTSRDADNNIITSGPLQQIFLPSNTLSDPQATTFSQVFANLDVRTINGTTYSSSTTIYDSKGAPHTLTITFTHNGINAAGDDVWAYRASIPDADTASGALNSGVLGNGTLTFDGTGTLLTPAANVAFTTPAFANGADALSFDWELYDDNNVPLITGYPIPSTTSATNTDGFPPGNLTSIIIDSEGIIEGVFSNGQVEQMAQLAIAQFNNPKGLLRLGQNLFAESLASGNNAIGAANTGGRGTIVGSALECSNVDMATEFTKMLVFQRGYQANSKTITTADTITQTALTICR